MKSNYMKHDFIFVFFFPPPLFTLLRLIIVRISDKKENRANREKKKKMSIIIPPNNWRIPYGDYEERRPKWNKKKFLFLENIVME